MAYDQLVRNLQDGKITIKDYNGTHSVQVAIDEGNLEATEDKTRRIVMHRGTIHHVRPGDQVPMSVKFSMQYSEFITASGCTPYEILTRRGNAAAYIGTRSTDGAAGPEDYTVDLEFLVNDPGGGSDEKLTFSDFAVENIGFKEGEMYSTIEVSGRAMVHYPTIAKV